MGNYTVYVNPYLVLRSGGYTKLRRSRNPGLMSGHYYIEGQRIVSKLSSGLDNNGKGQLKAGQDKVNYGKKQADIRGGIVKNLKWLGIDGERLTIMIFIISNFLLMNFLKHQKVELMSN